MNKLCIGKINLSKIDKSRLFKGEKGVYLDVAIWFSEEPDKYGNNLSIQQSPKKDEPKIYIGEAKFFIPKEDKPVRPMTKEDIINAPENTDDLPF